MYYGLVIDSADCRGGEWSDRSSGGGSGGGSTAPQLRYVPFRREMLPCLSKLFCKDSHQSLLVFEERTGDIDGFFKEIQGLLSESLSHLKYVVIKFSMPLMLDVAATTNHRLKHHLQQLINRVPHVIIDLPLLNNAQYWKVYFEYIKIDKVNVGFELTDPDVTRSILQLLSMERLQFIRLNSNLNQTFNPLINDLFKLYNYEFPIILAHQQQTSTLSSLKISINPTYNSLIDPLQPLRDDLDISIYDQFEQDIIKYNQYEKAIELGISDLIDTEKFTLKPIHVLVIGPGKGGIVHKLVKVIGKFNNQLFKIFAFEKNLKCLPYLHDYNDTIWQNQVTIIHSDIRTYNLDFGEPNLIISELLGSFGDNELCPEILHQFNQWQDRELPLIMIPSSYTSFVQPIYTNLTVPELERPYLVKLTKYNPLSPYQSVFNWDYPDPTIQKLDSISTTLKFKIDHVVEDQVTISGFYGHFTANLYGHLQIQIIRDDELESYCKSWYPIYFPIDPVQVLTNESIEFRISRINNGINKVWYEWEANRKIYNKLGHSYSIEF